MADDINLPCLPAYYAPEVAAAMRNYARSAVLADREAHGRQEVACLGLLADIRAAVGDPEGRLMQPELLERIRELAADSQRLQWVLDSGYSVRRRRDGHKNLLVWGDPTTARAEIDRGMGGPAA